jgi:hypothetical protein
MNDKTKNYMKDLVSHISNKSGDIYLTKKHILYLENTVGSDQFAGLAHPAD